MCDLKILFIFNFCSYNLLKIVRELSSNKILICNCSQLFKRRNTLFANIGANITNSCRSLPSVKLFPRVVVVDYCTQCSNAHLMYVTGSGKRTKAQPYFSLRNRKMVVQHFYRIGTLEPQCTCYGFSSSLLTENNHCLRQRSSLIEINII